MFRFSENEKIIAKHLITFQNFAFIKNKRTLQIRRNFNQLHFFGTINYS